MKLSVVSYINALPFKKGLENYAFEEDITVTEDIPSFSAQKLLQGKVDIALVPIAILNQLKEYYIISNYCIGSQDFVNTVALLSQHPKEELDYIVLDFHSKTSNGLIQLLARDFWQLKAQFVDPNATIPDSNTSAKIGRLIIGDRVFEQEHQYKFKYDLAHAWKEWQDLPMTFAVWVSRKPVSQKLEHEINKAFELGFSKLKQHIADLTTRFSKSTIDHYLHKNIAYDLNKAHQQSLQQYCNLLATLNKDDVLLEIG